MKILDAHSLRQQLDSVFEKLKFAAKLNVAFGFEIKSVEDWTCRFCFTHKNNTLMERSNFVATKEDLAKMKNVLSNIDMIEARTEKLPNTKWKLYKLTNDLVFAAPLKEVPVGCKYSVLPEPLTKTTLSIV